MGKLVLLLSEEQFSLQLPAQSSCSSSRHVILDYVEGLFVLTAIDVKRGQIMRVLVNSRAKFPRLSELQLCRRR